MYTRMKLAKRHGMSDKEVRYMRARLPSLFKRFQTTKVNHSAIIPLEQS
jgi:hypothetical protein